MDSSCTTGHTKPIAKNESATASGSAPTLRSLEPSAEPAPAIMVQPHQPWLLTNGKHTPDEHLKTLTPLWDEATWERYLTWYEGESSESLISPWRYDKICERSYKSIFVHAQENASDELRSQVERYLLSLTAQQQKVINLIFWECKTEREVAVQLGIKQVSVHNLKKRALRKISNLVKGAIASPLVRGEISPLSSETGEKHGKKVLALAEGALPKAG